jgi:spore coat polysaccharide biosynthesis protein SpsF
MKTKKIIAIIQARVGSTRLPGKVLKKISKKPVIWHVLNRVRLSKKIDDVIVAIPSTAENDILEDFIKKLKFSYFRGSEEDVLSRYYNTASRFNGEIIVRITSDCPLIDPEVVDMVIQEHINSNADYTSNTIKRTFPRGLDTEVFNYNTIEAAYNKARKDYEREHVTPYIYENPEVFTLNSIEAKGKLNRPDLRLTLDTKEDLRLIREIFKGLYRPGRVIYTKSIIEFLDRNPKIKSINMMVKQKEINQP